MRRKRDPSQKLLKTTWKRNKGLRSQRQLLKKWEQDDLKTCSDSQAMQHLMSPYDEESLEAPLEKLQKLLSTNPNYSSVSQSLNDSEEKRKSVLAPKVQLEEIECSRESTNMASAMERERQHFQKHLPDTDLDSASLYTRQRQKLDSFDAVDWYISKYSDRSIVNSFQQGERLSLSSLGWKQKMIQRVVSLREPIHGNPKVCTRMEERWTGLVCSHWMDGILELPDYCLQSKLVRPIYLAHAITYILRCRQRIIRNNKIQQTIEPSSLLSSERLKDQGFTRPRVLILLPMRNVAYDVVSMLLELLKDRFIRNYERFQREFYEESLKEDISKPLDYIQVFQGNTDDDFSMGIRMGASIKLFSDYYHSDMIVASPLGLKRLMEREDLEKSPKHSGADLLSNIEICIVERADVMEMQNWEHLRCVFERMNHLPKGLHGTDISRVTQRALEAKTKYYRQTIFISNYIFHHLLSLFRTHCHNIEGKARYIPHHLGIVSNKDWKERISIRIRQTFEKLPPSNSLKDSVVCRREFFIEKVLSRYSIHRNQTLIFIPSYFDYIQIRNIFYQKQKSGELSFETLCEYSSQKHIAQVKKDNSKQFYLMTERFYFYYRETLSGISNLIFYQLPEHGLFYEELVRSLENAPFIPTVLILYDHLDALSMERIVGTNEANKILNKSLYILG
ncbi:U3 small nucleolar RNA-associated protein 25 [Galdieria sulphuraria]|nr:U3 small nucleolar RNA-associated protein 25 [Galdieria sulphuraria]